MILNPCILIFKMIKRYVKFNQSENAETLQKLIITIPWSSFLGKK